MAQSVMSGATAGRMRYDTAFLTVEILRAAECLYGIDLGLLLDRAGLQVDFLDLPLRPLPFTVASHLVEGAVAATEDPLLGLRAGLHARLPRALGVAGILLSNAPSHRVWMENAARFHNRISNVGELSLEPWDDCVSFTLRRRVEACVYTDQTLDFHVGLAMGLARKSPDPRIKPTGVELIADRVRCVGHEVYEGILDCTIVPTRERAGTRYRAAALSLSLDADQEIYEVLAPVVEQELAKIPRIEQTRDIVSRGIERSLLTGCKPLDLGDAALLLGVSRRTLQQRLQEEGTSFQCLLDDVRRQLALRWLEKGISREDVSRRLGYSESAAFRRAWRRWSTG